VVHSAHPRKIPGCVVLFRENSSVNERAYERNKGILYIFFFKFYIWLSSKKVNNNNMIFELVRERKLSG